VVVLLAYDVLKQAVLTALKRSVTRLPQDVKEAIYHAYRTETSQLGKTQLEAIIKNFELAEKSELPICQDTGIPLFYVKVGPTTCSPKLLEKAIVEAVREATLQGVLRPNVVHPITRRNTGDNTGIHIPHIYWEPVDEDYVEITVLPKGGGSENMSAFAMLPTGAGVVGVKEFIMEAVLKAGSQPCPPTIIGVGIGGSADIAVKLAKQAVMRPLNFRSQDPDTAKLEQELLEAVNSTGIGPMGLGGKWTTLAVNIEYAHCHTASFPIALNMQCWAARRATIKLNVKGEVEQLTP